MSNMHWRADTPWIFRLALIGLMLVALAACEGMGSAQGGASDGGAHGRIKTGVPF
jgi:hypothetical protein